VHFTGKISKSGNTFPPKGREDEKADMGSHRIAFFPEIFLE